MKDKNELKDILPPLLRWYRKNARTLPWRGSKNPYEIWVSEIMLQQTRVEAVKPYYERFLQALPDVKALAEAEEESLLKLWEGLGYYSRVRNMQQAARQIMTEYGGVIPADYGALLKLKGIGPYTAGAIASIAFSLPFPAVDGNVLRVMARLTADAADISLASTKKQWEQRITEILEDWDAGEINQALMELGATVCQPNGAPRCDICPLRSQCLAYERNRVMQFPVKAEKKARVVEKRAVFFLTDGKQIALQKRTGKGVLSGLWELPGCAAECSFPAALQNLGILNGEIIPMKFRKHIFTHVEWHMDSYFVLVSEKQTSSLIWKEQGEIEESYALPSAFKKIWQEGLERMGTKKNEGGWLP